MKALLNRIHERVGDLWWYSAMIFLACRSGDVIQAFIGLWLVPKYVGPQELGAVLPLQQLSTLFTVPLAIIATVFTKYVNTYATHGELGKVKCFIRDVLATSSLIFIVCIAVAYWLVPHFYSRLNVTAGTLTILILLSGFVGNVSNLFNAALQGLKMFKTMTIQNFISAPIRLVTLLIAMPIRALSGYILGQTTPLASCSLLAAFSLKKTLKNAPTDNSWRIDLPEIFHYLWPYALCTIVTTLTASIMATVYRQRLPEIESSANYMLSRFAEIAGFFGYSINAILFPLASEAHERKQEDYRPLLNGIAGSILFSFVLATLFGLLAPMLFTHIDTWSPYKEYVHILPVMTICTGLSLVATTITSYELACRRVASMSLTVVANCLYAFFLVSVTGIEFFRGWLPDALIDWISSLHFAQLSTLTHCSLAFCILQLCGLLFLIAIARSRRIKNANLRA